MVGSVWLKEELWPKTAADAHRLRKERLKKIEARAVKEPEPQPEQAPAPVPKADNDSSGPVYRMWFDDLIEYAERILARKYLPEIKRIQVAVAEHHGMPWEVMFISKRTKDVVRARQVAMYLANSLAHKSLPEIGRRFGGRDHTTVLHAVRKIEGKVQSDPDFAAEIDNIKQRLGVVP